MIQGIPGAVKAVVAQVDESAVVILFGSRARGEATALSDWDFLILTLQETTIDYQDQIRALLYEVELANGVVISSVIENIEIWKLYKESEFYKNISKEGVEILLQKAA